MGCHLSNLKLIYLHFQFWKKNMSDQQIPFDFIVSVLKQVEIFRNIPLEVVRELGKKMLISNLDADESIIKQGDKGSSMYVVLKGEVKVHDKEYSIANLPEGSFFGEFSLLDDEPRSLSVTTIDPSIIGNILQVDFYAIINKYPEITRDIIKVMLKRLRNQNQQIIGQLRQKQMELEKLVKERTSDLRKKNIDLEKTLNELKRTQEQLVQQEKLASLGQITAGIAHEIQNPLNFINNFSSLSKELADEIIVAKDNEEQLDIISDLKFNLSRIEDHGKRADGIVKAMLLHSQSTKGEKQPSDICALCEQSLNLAFNSLDGTMKNLKFPVIKNYEDNIPQVKVISQELSRVLINLINNAYYAINEKMKKAGTSYSPSLILQVKNENGSVLISVRDNGIGIPDANKKRIFQPFFTTKPTGQGTGLGLSSGNEIVKLHGGEMKFDSLENEYAEFSIRLPLS
jgi:signal transduction histidine kinase